MSDEEERRPQRRPVGNRSVSGGIAPVPSHEYPSHQYPTVITTELMDGDNSLLNEDLTLTDWYLDPGSNPDLRSPEHVIEEFTPNSSRSSNGEEGDVDWTGFERGVSRGVSRGTFNVDVSTINKGDAETEVDSDLEQSELVASTSSECTTYDRAEFVSATVIRPTRRMNLGLNLRMVNGQLEIAGIEQNGLLKDSPLQVGDKLLSIGFENCAEMNLARAAQLLKKSMGIVTIIARNVSGNPQLVESMITKPTPGFGTGIFFTSGRQRQLTVHDVPQNGLFAQSIVSKRDIVLSINDVSCAEIDALIATDIVKSAPRYVTILAQSSGDSAVAVQSRIGPSPIRARRRRR